MNKKLPSWLNKKIPTPEKRSKVKNLVESLNINTVCQEANCPNIGECFSNKTATFMILGENCTRNCKFCAVSAKKPTSVDKNEPRNIARAVKKLGLTYVVITSVTRDDLADGGVKQFVKTINEIKKISPKIRVEILTPDFQGKKNILKKLKKADFEIFAHNIETVPDLYQKIRPEANYNRSLNLLSYMREIMPDIYIKSGLMLGLGESEKEVLKVLNDLYEVGVEIITIGQYLAPSSNHAEVKEYIKPKKFEEYKEAALDIGFETAVAGPFVRSSYRAEKNTPENKDELD